MSETDRTQKIVDAFKNYLQLAFSITTGTRISFRKAKNEDIEEFDSIIREYVISLRKIEDIDSLRISEKRKAQKAYEILNKFGHIALPEIPEDQDYFEWNIEESEKKLRQPPESMSINKSNYFFYLKLIKNLMNKVFENFPNFSMEFFVGFLTDEDKLITTQSLISRLHKHYNYLEKKRKRITKKHVEKLIQTFDDFAGQYEKYLNLIYGLVMILDKETEVRYPRIKTVPTHKKLEYLESKSRHALDFLPLVSSYNKTLRNAIAHKSYLYNPISKEIWFVGRRKKIPLSYLDFENEVKNLGTLVLALSKFSTIMIMLSARGFQVFIRR